MSERASFEEDEKYMRASLTLSTIIFWLAWFVRRSMKGLPKLCVISSDHECTSDETYDLVEKCRKAGVEVKHYSQKYLCHVYALLPFLPEAQAAEKQIVDFLTV